MELASSGPGSSSAPRGKLGMRDLALHSMAAESICDALLSRYVYVLMTARRVRRHAETCSEVVGTLPAGARVHIVQTRRMSNGALRVHIVMLGRRKALGWLTLKTEKGVQTMRLIGADGAVPPVDDPFDRLILPAPYHLVAERGSQLSARGSQPSGRSSPRRSLRDSPLRSARDLCSPRPGATHPFLDSFSANRFPSPHGHRDAAADAGKPGAAKRSSSAAARVAGRVSSPTTRGTKGSPQAALRGIPRVFKLATSVGQEQGGSSELESGGAMPADTKQAAAAQKLKESSSLEQVARDYLSKAETETAMLSDRKLRSLKVRLGDHLVEHKVKTADLVSQWAKCAQRHHAQCHHAQRHYAQRHHA